MFITKKHLSRRTVLRGMGASISLPLLESMVPAQTPLRQTAAAPKTRLTCIYVPHGAIMGKWTPATEGREFEFSEILKLTLRSMEMSRLCWFCTGDNLLMEDDVWFKGDGLQERP